MDDDGSVMQSSIQHVPHQQHIDPTNAQGWVTRAVVLQTYFTEEDTRNGWVKGIQRNITCDVRTMGRYSRQLQKVPVMQRTQGLHDEDNYIPRASTQDIATGNLLIATSSKDKRSPTAAESLDGDHVLIGFLDNDPNQPVILPFQFSHPKSAYQPKKADGRCKRMRHGGTLIQWSEDGNLKIDASKAATAALGAKGVEVPTLAGQITIQVENPVTSIILKRADGSIAIASSGPMTRSVGKNLTETVGVDWAMTVSGEAKLRSAKDFDVKASATLKLDGASVELGTNPTEPVIKGTAFLIELLVVLGAIAAKTVPPTTPAVVTFSQSTTKWLSQKVKTE